jgi:hypothetical protein
MHFAGINFQRHALQDFLAADRGGQIFDIE